MTYSDGCFVVQYRNATVRFRENPFWQGLIDFPGYVAKCAPKEGNVVIDAGAYAGVFSLIAAKLVGNAGRVIAFEPDALNYRILERNVADNGITNLALVTKGLWSREGHLSLADGLGKESRLSLPEETIGGAAKVEVSSMDRELERQGINRVDFVKADIEGAELEFLKGAEKTLPRSEAHVAIASYHILDGQTTSERVENILREYGYETETGFPPHVTTYGWRPCGTSRGTDAG
jgi:FkbM family methyltransferase